MSDSGKAVRRHVLVHGAWLGSLTWKQVVGRLRDEGFRVHLAELSGLNPAEDVAGIGLEPHVRDVIRLLESGDLRGVILVGHSYSGPGAGQVADRLPDRVAHTVFVEAFVPDQGKSLLDDFSDDPAERDAELAEIAANGGRWPPPTASALTEQEGLSEPVRLNRPMCDQRGTHSDAHSSATSFRPCSWSSRSPRPGASAGSRPPTWSHWPMLTAPERLVAELVAVR
jgi:pimeloyl-ACP methyl ester carboxylesterase